MLWWISLLLFLARADDAYIDWAHNLHQVHTDASAGLSLGQVSSVDGEHPEPAYLFAQDVHAHLLPLVLAHPGLVRVRDIGHTVRDRPIWAFTVNEPGWPITQRVLVFANIHAMEWMSTEVAVAFLEDLVAHPVRGVAVTVIPILNADGRDRVERDLLSGDPHYRRANANGVDLNRDFAVNREARAVWRHLIPAYYATSPAPLSQPESQAIDRLADEQRFDVAVSLHAFGGYLYYPWAGRWGRPPDRREFVALGHVMAGGMGTHPYKTRQLSHWGFFFRGQGMEIDHLYQKYGTRAFLIELTRSGLSPLRPAEWRDHFRWYNPHDPTRHVRQGVGALRALVWHLQRAPVSVPVP